MISNFHNLHLFKTAEHRLLKAITSNTTYTITGVLNFLNGDIKLTVCNTRKLHRHKAANPTLAVRHLSLSGKKRLIVEPGGFLLPLLSAVLPTIVSINLRNK